MTTQGDLAALFDRRAAVVLLPIEPDDGTVLFPAEQGAVRNVVLGRRSEFASGRRCAHLAMEHLGRPSLAVPMGPDRAPVWPHGIVGSITHTDTMSAAVAALTADGIRSLGIDLEPALPLPEDAVDTILRPEERRRLASLPKATQLLHARIIFCAKEAFFKCQYGISRVMIDFHVVAIRLDLADGSFEAALTQDAGIFPARQVFAGRFHLDAALIAAGMTLEG